MNADAGLGPLTREQRRKLMPALISAIATRIAKDEHGPHYEGYESSHRDAAGRYAATAMGVFAAFGLLDPMLLAEAREGKEDRP